MLNYLPFYTLMLVQSVMVLGFTLSVLFLNATCWPNKSNKLPLLTESSPFEMSAIAKTWLKEGDGDVSLVVNYGFQVF